MKRIMVLKKDCLVWQGLRLELELIEWIAQPNNDDYDDRKDFIIDECCDAGSNVCSICNVILVDETIQIEYGKYNEKCYSRFVS